MTGHKNKVYNNLFNCSCNMHFGLLVLLFVQAKCLKKEKVKIKKKKPSSNRT